MAAGLPPETGSRPQRIYSYRRIDAMLIGTPAQTGGTMVLKDEST
jgi:hypothetical protein